MVLKRKRKPKELENKNKSTNGSAFQELHINNKNPWELAEYVYMNFIGMLRDVDELWPELSLLERRIADMK